MKPRVLHFTFESALSVLYSYLPKMKDGAVFFLAAVGSMVISMMLENYSSKLILFIMKA